MESAAPRSRAAIWFAGARPRTLGASIVPVAVGTALSAQIHWAYAALAFVVAVGLQVGVNYANDYFDGRRGVDTAERVGPVRLTAGGLAAPRAVLAAALASFVVAGLAGLALAIKTDLRLLIVGAAAIAAALAYSGGPKPYAGLGLGELFVFLFFGVVPVAGTAYVQSYDAWDSGARLTPISLWAGVVVGMLAVAILLANNIRDIETDAAAGKRTLPVRIGHAKACALYRVMVAGSFAVVIAAIAFRAFPGVAALALVAAAFAARPLSRVGSAKGPALVRVLLDTVTVEIVAGALLVAAFAIVRSTNPLDIVWFVK